MSIMDFFRPAAPAAPAAAPSAAPAQAPAAGAPPATPQDGNHANTGTPNQPVNPLDAYAKMYDNAAKATPDVAPSFALDQKTVGEVTSSLDFTKEIPQDLMTKALQGDAQALLQAMNHVARGAYQTTLQHQSLLTDKFIGARLEHDSKQLGSRVKSELTGAALANTPNYSHPVVKAELNRIANMLQREHPDASPAQIAQSAQEYLMNVTNAVRPGDNKANEPAQEFDWSSYLTK